MTRLTDPTRGERAFTLIEVMVAMLVFSLVTLGVVPLLAATMKGATVSRASSVGEELARNAMERVRGVKYFTSYDAKPGKRVDLLDLYYPGVSGTFLPGQSYAVTTNPPLTGSGGVFTTACSNPPSSPANPACPTDLPDGYALTFKASFVKPITTTSPQTYGIVTPASSYRYDVAPGGNLLPADLLDLAVTASWVVGGQTRTFTLRSIVGERKFSAAPAVNAGPSPSAAPSAPASGAGPRIRGRATIDYTFHGETGFSSGTAGTGCPAAPCKSEMIADVGTAESRIELQDFAKADQTASFGNVRIVRTYPPGQTPPAIPPDDLVNVSGATSTLQAPPTANLATDGAVGSQNVIHSEISSTAQAALQASHNRNLKVSVADALPYAEGFYGSTPTTQGTEFTFSNTQRDATVMKYNSSQPAVWFTGPLTGWLPPRLGTFTSAKTGALGTADRGVTAAAEAGMPSFNMFRLQLGNNIPTLFGLQYLKTTVNCKSTANPATAAATATGFAYLYAHYDPKDDGKPPNSFESINITLDTAGGHQYEGVASADPLAQMRAANPMVADGTSVCCSSTSDIFLFEERNSSGTLTKRGYFKSITMSTPERYVSPDGRTTRAGFEGFLRIETTPLNPAIPETATSISLGKLSCEAVDNR